MIDRLQTAGTVRVLSVASEIFPLVKTGGLADVAGALPAALAPHGRRDAHAGAGLPCRACRPRAGAETDRATASSWAVRRRCSPVAAAGLDAVRPRRPAPLRPPRQSLSRPRRPRLAGQLPPFRRARPRRGGHRPRRSSPGGPTSSTPTTGRRGSPRPTSASPARRGRHRAHRPQSRLPGPVRPAGI